MELLLLLWFYDNRWFFNLKISIICFKNSWIIPLFLNAIMMTICLYFLIMKNGLDCEAHLRQWLYLRTFFSLLIILNILVFMIKITDLYEEEIQFLEKSKKIYPVLKGEMNKLDFWVRRKSMRTWPGICLLILGLISLTWSFMIVTFYHSDHVYKNCDIIIRKLLDIHSMFIFLGNIPIILILLTLLTVKIFSLISSYVCPGLLISLSTPFKNEIIEA